MTNRNKIQEWSGKRVDHTGTEYQIDAVFNKVRFIQILEGRYPENVAQMLGEKTVTFNGETYLIYTWMTYRVEHNAVEVNQKCGHVTVVTDEYVNDVWNDEKSRNETIDDLKKSLCTKCHNERLNKKLDENENLAHLMPSDSPDAY